jgi:Dihydrodipicolinate synthetase family
MPMWSLPGCAGTGAPFTPDAETVDEPTLRAQADRLIRAGIHGFVTTGSTGEFSTLTPEEYRRVIELYVDAAAHRVPVVAGVGALSTRGPGELARHAESVGADAIMLLPPFYGGVDLAGSALWRPGIRTHQLHGVQADPGEAAATGGRPGQRGRLGVGGRSGPWLAQEQERVPTAR